VLALAGAAGAAPRRYVLDSARSAIRFHAGSRFMDADGTFHRLAGELRLDPEQPETVSGRIVVDVASIDTGIGLRDDHLRSDEFLDAARHPQAVFAVGGARPADAGAPGRWLVTGDLTIRGVTRPLTVPVTVARDGGTLRIAGRFALNRRDFGVSYQSWLNPVRDEVTVSVDLTATATP